MKTKKIKNEKSIKKLNWIVYILIAIFIITLMPLGKYSMPLTILFFLFGTTLIFLTLKYKVPGKLKIFLLLTGASPILLLISVFLHNLLETLETQFSFVFFFLAIIISPILFLIGAIGSIIYLMRKLK